MKKITLGSICLFSLVLCAGVHAMDKKPPKDSFLKEVEKACFQGNIKLVKWLVEGTETPSYYRSGKNGFGGKGEGECKTSQYGLTVQYLSDDGETLVDIKDKYAEAFKTLSDRVMFYDRAFDLAVIRGHYDIAEYLLTSKDTKGKISDWEKAELILMAGIERDNMDIVTCMMNFEKQKLINYNVKVLEIVSKELKKKNK